MKRMIMTAMAALICCMPTLAQDRNENDTKKKIEGSGNVITKEYPVGSFSEIDASGVFNLVLIQGSKEGVKVEADDNLQELFDIGNEGSKLRVKMKKDANFNSKTKMKVYVTFRQVGTLDLKMVGGTSNEGQLSFDNLSINNKCVGNITLNLAAKTLEVDNKGVGDMKLTGKADEATIVAKSVGSISAADFIVQKMNIENSGVGSAEVNAAKELTVKDSFLGKVRNRGAAAVKKAVRI